MITWANTPSHKRNPAPAQLLAAGGLLLRKCACGGTPGASGECETCRHRRLGVLQRPAPGSHPGGGIPPIVHDVLRTPGEALDGQTRTFMESRFGHDFGQVRVHTDARAAESARAVNALAYTVGRNVVFGSGQYAPGQERGRKLLAHELTHTIQQRGELPPALPAGQWVVAANDALEREAHAAERIVAGSEQYRPGLHTGPRLARQERASSTPSFGPACSGGDNDPCQQSRCSERQLTTIRSDISGAINYVNAAIAAVSASALTEDTTRALDWYFNDHREATVAAVRTRLGCILECLQDTQSNSRFGCHPDYNDVAYVCPGGPAICEQVQTNICFTNRQFGRSARARTQTVIHECAHRVGMSVSARSLPDIYRYTPQFLYMDTEEALRNSDSFALFAGAIAEGMPLTVLFPVIGVTGGLAAPSSGSATWRASLYYGVEFQNPILGFFNPTLGIGLSVIGETTTGGTTPITSPASFLVSLLPGVRIGDPRPSAEGGGYMSLFGGPALAVGSTTGVGAEAGLGFGYRWRWLDVSAGVGYTYDPTREAGMDHLVTGSVGLTFTPFVLSSPEH